MLLCYQQGAITKTNNAKAFAFNSAVKAEKMFRRRKDLQEKRHHIPLVDRTPIEPPPYVVAIVGPPKVGKSTLLKCLIKNYTRQIINNINGPVCTAYTTEGKLL